MPVKSAKHGNTEATKVPRETVPPSRAETREGTGEAASLEGGADGAHTRARACRALGLKFAELLGERHSHQLGVCARLGIPWRTHMSWMAKDASGDADLTAYQCEVLAGLDAQRVADLDDIDRVVGDAAVEPGRVSTLWNVRKHRHEGRFKRFYDDPTKVELSGPDGGALQVDVVAKLSDAELRKLAMDGDDE